MKVGYLPCTVVLGPYGLLARLIRPRAHKAAPVDDAMGRQWDLFAPSPTSASAQDCSAGIVDRWLLRASGCN